ncbi:hypothetical protein [Oceanithermus profundus]
MKLTRSFTLFLALTAALALAQPEFSGSFQTGFGLRTQDLALTLDRTRFDLGVRYDQGDAAFTAELRFAYDARTRSPEFGLGEAYATLFLPSVDLSVGREVVAWGRLDLLSPLDVLNPRDLSSPLDQAKLPVGMVHATAYPDAEGRYQLEAVWIPLFTPSTPPAGEWAPPQTLPPGVTQVRVEEPAAELASGTFGLRATASLDVLEGLDLGGQVVYGYFPFPSPQGVEPVDPAQPAGPFRLVMGYDRRTLVGADFALAFSIPGVAEGLVLRGEAAYALTADPDGADPNVQNPYAEGGLALEYAWSGGPTTVLAYDLRWAKADAPAADAWTQTLGLMARYEYDERLTLQGAWLHTISDGSGLVRPALEYAFADGVTGRLSAAFFYGADATRFGVWRNNSELRTELEYSF